MSADDRDQELDQLFDAALKNYSRVEPPPGLEQRIQAGLEAAVRRAPHLAWSGWLLPATAVAVAFVAAVIIFQRPAAPPAAPPTRVAETNPAEPPAPAPAASGISSPKPSPRRLESTPAARAAALPRRERFPAPAPLSQQELYLLRYLEAARSSPPPAPKKADAFAALTLEPLQFPALKIEKLERNP